nr:hypothetical conserved protein [uncultured Gammaproteobacteria bacterium]
MREDTVQMDPEHLYREEVYTDLKTGTIKQLIPVTGEGLPDPSRDPVFLGQATVLTPLGSLPLSFEIEAKTLREAIAKYAQAAEQGLKETLEELKRLQQEQASSLVIPKGGIPTDLKAPGFSGKIKLP